MTTEEQQHTVKPSDVEPTDAAPESTDAETPPMAFPEDTAGTVSETTAASAPEATAPETSASQTAATTDSVTPAAVPEQQPTPSVADMLAASQTSATVSTASPPVTAPPVAPTPEAVAPAADASTVPDTAGPATAVEATAVEATAANAGPDAAQEKPSERVRQKLGVQAEDRPRGSEDIKTLRPDVPTNTDPVGIPESDDLDTTMEAEIAAAMGTATVPTGAAPPPVETFEDAPITPPPPGTEPEEVGPGSKVTGTVQHIHGDDVFLNAGLLADVVVSLKQFPADKPPEVGASVKVVIELMDEDGLFRARLPQARSKGGGNWDGLATGQVVDCMVTGTNKGGLQITVSNIKGFLPASQVDLGYVADLQQYVGQKLAVQITEVKPKKKNLVVSRRALLQAERESTQGEFLKNLDVGQDFTGTVKTLKNYGAFVNLGPIDGFLHVGEISWSRINHPNEVLKEGQEVQVRILKFDKEKNRISLGMKQLVQNPWQGLNERYPSERIVNGKVTRITDFGAFVELEPGVEGLVHISELAWRRVGSVGEVLKVGDEKEFKVLEVDQKRRRVSLSLKALEQKPEAMQKADAAEEEARPVRRPNLDLRGGTGGNSGNSGLFGNPSDFT